MLSTGLFALLVAIAVFHYTHSQNYGPQRYEIEEDPARQAAAAPSYRPSYYAPSRATYDPTQLNQYYQSNQPSQNLENLRQYMASMQQFHASALKAPSQYPTSALGQTQNYASAPSSYPSPLGVLYSAANDVSQFQYSGNGVNYSF